MHYFYQVFKNFLHKKFYNFHRPDVDLYNFHPQLRFLLAMNGVFFNKRDSLLRFIWPCLVTGFSIAWIVLQAIFIKHFLDIKDYSLATESFCYNVILGCVPMVYISLITNSDKMYDLVLKMNRDFLTIRNWGPRYLKPFLARHLYIWQLCWIWYGFEICVGSVFVIAQITTLCYHCLFATRDEYSTRPLQFPMWLPKDDPYRTPNYEIFVALQLFIVVCVVNTFSVYVYSLLHVLLHYYGILEMIILDIEVLFDGLEESVALLPRNDPRRMETQHILNKRIERIVKMHLSVFASVKTVSSVYGPPLVYQIVCTSIAICLTSYQMAEKLENGIFDILFFSLVCASCVQLWIPCYLGTMVRDKGYDVGDACWNCGWHLTPLGLLVRNDITIIIMKTQQPLTIEYTGLPSVNLRTYSVLMSKSYSYFNMVRQYIKQ